MAIDKKGFGAALKAARVENRITQEQLAEMIGIAPSHVKQIEAGNRSPSLDVLFKLAQVLGFSIDEIFFPGRKDEPELLYKIERSLKDCSVHDLHVVYSTLTALRNRQED